MNSTNPTSPVVGHLINSEIKPTTADTSALGRRGDCWRAAQVWDLLQTDACKLRGSDNFAQKPLLQIKHVQHSYIIKTIFKKEREEGGTPRIIVDF